MPLSQVIKSYGAEFIAFLLAAIFLLLHFQGTALSHAFGMTKLPSPVFTAKTVFLSVILEATPFILLGSIASAAIQIFVSEEKLQKWIPKNPILAVIPAVIIASLFPVCECAIILVVRRLIKKGLPLHIGAVFMIASPLLNPIVDASTFFAFQSNLTVLYARMGLGFLIAILVGLLTFVFFKNSDQLKLQTDDLVGSIETDKGAPSLSKWKQILYHTSDEFFDMGKFLIIGACITSLFQTFLNYSSLLSIASNPASSTGVMMVLAYILSLCSEADAFVASSLGGTFTLSSILAFLLLGPMLDIKSTIMLFAYFRVKFVLFYMAIVSVCVFVAVMLFHYL